jgi:uncharacterized membrane protein
MKSHAAIKNHPIHPMLVTIPIGLWIASLVCDVIYASTRTVFWYDMAWWAMAFGVLGALAAAVPGLIDYNTTIRNSERAYPIARLHMILNFSAVALYVLNLWMRADYAATTGTMLVAAIGLSVLTIVGVSVSGWLGGELVYRYGIGMGREELRISMMETEKEEAELPKR